MSTNVQFRLFDSIAKKMYYPNDPTVGRSVLLTMAGEVVTMRQVEGKVMLLPIVSSIIMLRTSIPDDAGNKMYEGDIVDFLALNEFGSGQPMRGLVAYDPATHSHIIRMFSGDGTKERIGINSVKVVGNVLEHPELDPSQLKT